MSGKEVQEKARGLELRREWRRRRRRRKSEAKEEVKGMFLVIIMMIIVIKDNYKEWEWSPVKEEVE